MQRVGVEPTKALSHKILSLADLTTLEPLHMFFLVNKGIKILLEVNFSIFEG